MTNLSHSSGICVAAFTVAVSAGVLAEQDAVRMALERNPSIRVARISRSSDSLRLENAKAGFLPHLDLGVDLSWTPSGDGALAADVSAAGSQALPGGGTVGASVTPSATRDLGTGELSVATVWQAGVRQPLTAGAGRYGQPTYELMVQRVNVRESDVRFRQRLAASLSTVRSRYWAFYERSRTRAIAAEAAAQAERLRARERTRFAVGDASQIDTLGAALEYHRSQQALLSAEAALSLARRDLAAVLMIPADSVELPDTLEVSVEDLPDPAELLDAVRAYDPQRSLFELAYEKLQIHLGQRHNALLPKVDLAASYRHTSSPAGPAPAGNSVFALIAAYSLPTRTKRIEATLLRLSMEQSRAEAAQYDRELSDRVAALVESWSVERRKLASAELAAEVARRKFDVAEKSYEIGAMDQLSYLQARQDAFDAATGALQQSIGLKRLEIVFDELTGKVLSRFGVQIR